MDEMIETDMTNRLKREVEEFIEQLANRGFAIDEMDLVDCRIAAAPERLRSRGIDGKEAKSRHPR